MSARTTVKSIQDIMRQDTGVDGDAQRISQLCWMFFLKIIDDQDQELELLSADYRSHLQPQYQWRNWAADPEGITGEELLAFVNAGLFPALKNLQVSAQPGDRRRVVKEVFEDAYNYMKSGHLMRQVVNKITAIDFNNLTERQHFGDIYEQVLNDLQSAGNAGEYPAQATQRHFGILARRGGRDLHRGHRPRRLCLERVQNVDTHGHEVARVACRHD